MNSLKDKLYQYRLLVIIVVVVMVFIKALTKKMIPM